MSSELPQQEFEIGDPVEVLINQRNSTGRVGLIARVIWHHRDACYNYYLKVDGKQVSKRYFASDLMRVPSNNSYKPNPLRGAAKFKR